MSDVEKIVGVSTGGASLLVTEPRRQRKEAEAEQRKAGAAQRKIQDIKTQRERRQAVREARAARAEILSGAVASGTTSTSSVEAGVAGLGTQLASNLSFLEQASELTNQISIFEQNAANKLRRAGEIDSIRNTGLQVASLFA